MWGGGVVCIGGSALRWGLHRGGRGLYPAGSVSGELDRPPPPQSDRSTMGYGKRAGGMHLTGIHSY